VDLTEAEGYWAPPFDFERVKLVADIAVGFAKDQQDDPRQFMVEMTVAIPNDPEDGKRAPYTLHIQAQAWIEAADGIPKELIMSPSHNPSEDGGIKPTTDNGRIALRPSGTELLYKRYAESFRDTEHLQALIDDAQAALRQVAGEGSESAAP